MVIVVFDMDGTLIEGDSWRATNSYFGVENRHIFSYLRGEITYEKYLKLTCKEWARKNGGRVYYKDLEEAVRNLTARDGLKELMDLLEKRGWRKGIISAGIDSLSSRFCREFDFDFCFANGFEYEIENGKRRLNGKGIPRVELKRKGEVLEGVLNVFENDLCIVLGNTKYDIPMFKRAKLSIAINPKDEETEKSADFVINGKDFYPVIELLDSLKV
jgi:HAD superfamily PSPase-like hydrolase